MSDVQVTQETLLLNRKKPFRCTPEEDIILLKAVIARFPYGGEHGTKESLWEMARSDFVQSVSETRPPFVPGIRFTHHSNGGS